jgi:phage terminase small subunit
MGLAQLRGGLMPGPPPKPTALKVLTGNPGKRRLNDAEPKPPVGAQPPAYVKADPTLLSEWHRHAARLTKLGLLTEIDDDALATLCVLQVRMKDALAVSRGEGAVLGTGVILDLAKELRMLWARFGMTPADRSRVKVEKPKPETKLSRFTVAK